MTGADGQGHRGGHGPVAKWRPDPWEEAEDAAQALAEALDGAGLTLPSLGVDQWPVITGRPLVELGRARPDVVTELAELVTRGTRSETCSRPTEGADALSRPGADEPGGPGEAGDDGSVLITPDDLVTIREDDTDVSPAAED
ncbi:hypothetical protein ACH437_01945 [Streptomyces xinghaiensis]|uniref:hypothetical protein n=1 Tax=Streptomyces xinghaiensis TaxID=1038928 RepID=UPI0037A13BB6